MGEIAHTGGPWEAREDRTVSAGGVPLLRCYAGRNAEANARLIAASPCLLTALLNIRDNSSGWQRDTAQDAIAKALPQNEGGEQEVSSFAGGIDSPAGDLCQTEGREATAEGQCPEGRG